jgi:hypothetical protein
MDHIHIGGIIGQLDYGILIDEGSPVKHVIVKSDMHNFRRSAIKAGNAPNLKLTIIGGNLSRWNYFVDQSGLNLYAVQLKSGDALIIQGVQFEGKSGATHPAVYFEQFNNVQITANAGDNLNSTPVAYSSTGEVIIKDNAGASWPVVDTISVIAFTPVVTFAGNNTGLTYGFRGADVMLGANRWVDVNIYTLLSAKGSSTGELRINLPHTSFAGNPWVLSVRMDAVTPPANCIGYVAVINGGHSYARVFAHLSTGGVVALTDANITNSTNIIITGRYRRA